MKPHDRPESALSTQIVDGVPVVEITGALDLANVDAFSATVADLARQHSGGIVVALKTTTYLDSRGVDGLIRCAQWLTQGRQGLVVADSTCGPAAPGLGDRRARIEPINF